SHLILENSELISGQNYSENSEVNKILNDENYYSVMLYPGRQSIDLTPLNTEDRQVLFPQNKQLAVFVIDGTWATARKMVSQSMNLASLPRICFTPPRPSQFRVRKQPHPLCYSTIEAIHHTIELIGDSQTFSVMSREHDKLLKVFDFMVERQLFFIQESLLNSRTSTYRKPNSRNLLVPVL
ncbi:MAG: tRNA-uridine aminocarboxypropyltransferase, partial [Pseudobdellovibrionaceae bacterium]